MLDSPFTDLDRPPLSQAALTRALVHPGSLWSGITVVGRTGSTNADLAQAVRDGARQGAVVIAEASSPVAAGSAGSGALRRARA